ncbi:MarR family transcriptional regulator, partial [Vibrio fortis]
QKDIAIKSKVENSTTTRTLDKLEKLELVERRADPESRRSFRIYLTEKGKALEETLIPIPMRLNKELMGALDESEQQQMLQLLKKMVADI